MDAVHNIPELLNQWEDCDEPALRSALEYFDRRWFRSEGDLNLCRLLDDIIAKSDQVS